MEVAEKFKEIVLKEQRDLLFPFLQQLDKAEKKAVAKARKELDYLWEYDMVKKIVNGWSYESPDIAKGSDSQKEMMFYTSFVCDSYTTFIRQNSHIFYLQMENLSPVLDWYMPNWFGKLVLYILENEWLRGRIDYHTLLNFQDQRIVELPPENILQALLRVPFLREDGLAQAFEHEKLLLRKDTLEEHIWFVFQYQSAIHYQGIQSKKASDEPVVTDWHGVFKFLDSKGLIARKRLLQEAILASNRNFDRNLSGWFISLFEYLEPTVDELMMLSPELKCSIWGGSRRRKAPQSSTSSTGRSSAGRKPLPRRHGEP